jgi:hypothetical protein
MHPLRLRARAAVAILLVGCLSADAGVEQVMELNRAGEWVHAEALARELLATLPPDSVTQRCEAMTGRAYALLRLDRLEEAAAALDVLDRECASLPENHWIRSEARRVRAEVAAKPPALEVHEDGFWKTALASEVGVDPAVLDRHGRLCDKSGADACLVVRRGKIVQEWHSPRYRKPMLAMSSTKSVTGILRASRSGTF